MLLETIIRPRRDGTVVVTAGDGSRYVFAPIHDGRIQCDVADEHARWLLAIGGYFEPADVLAPPPKEQSIDAVLRNLDKSGLLAYAKQNNVTDVDGRMSAATLRAKIAEAKNVKGA